ncbi:hypothetical protein DSO57_1012494 [Entomophthora muscae]|uniref:Uncharacterized protein n=1 Tax=Entomophthora muscae TaxID=34485 RepID=A0ACC2SJ10_9FUNG|nr:hypothetical protein DSO57_1012494 [Entomophthora muscae]
MGAQSQKSAGSWSCSPQAQGDPGSGFSSCSWAWVSREEELSILTAISYWLEPKAKVYLSKSVCDPEEDLGLNPVAVIPGSGGLTKPSFKGKSVAPK